MIDFRYISLSIVILASNLLVNSVSHANRLQNNHPNQFKEPATILDQTNIADSSQGTTTRISQKKDAQLLNASTNHLALLGIVATSILFLIVLVMLFKKDKQAEDFSDSIDAQQTVTKTAKVKSEIQPIEPDSHLTSNTLKPKLAVAQTNQAITSQSNKSMMKGLSVESLPKNEAIINSDLMGKLTIVSTSTTEIDVVFELIQDLQQNLNSTETRKQKDLRRKAIWELGKTNDFRAVEPLIQTMSKVDSLEKSLILDSITKIANHSLETINEVLLDSLRDSNGKVRKNAIQDLAHVYQSIFLVTAHLSKMTKDADSEVRQTARWALDQFEQMAIPIVSLESNENQN